ncbi:MAG: hypothetical protein LBJ32_00260, partial [Oscillospiraceae bacterium]|nr:hypothetical protein [Oscillospiraceae bacterium]
SKGKSKYFLKTENYDGSIIDVEVNFEIYKFEVDDFWKNDWQERKRKKELSLDDLGQVVGGLNTFDKFGGRNVSNEALSFLTSKSAEDKAFDKLENEELEKVIGGLSEKQKRRIEMRFFGNMTFEEIAKIEKTATIPVYKSIKLALKILKKILENY